MTYAVMTLPGRLRRSQEQLTMNLKVFEERLKAKEAADELAAKQNAITEGIAEEEDEAEEACKADSNPAINITCPPPAASPTIAVDQDEPKKEL